MAWFTSILLAPHTKTGRPPAINSLLPPCFQENPKPISPEQAKEELASLRKELKVE